MDNQAYEQGFLDKCAAANVDPDYILPKHADELQERAEKELKKPSPGMTAVELAAKNIKVPTNKPPALPVEKTSQQLTATLNPTGATAVGLGIAHLVGSLLGGAALGAGGYAGYRGMKHLIDKRTARNKQEQE